MHRLVIPIAAYVSAKSTQTEGNGIIPDVPIPWSFEDVAAGIDRQLIGAGDASDATINSSVLLHRLRRTSVRTGKLKAELTSTIKYRRVR
jgi:C-terminal processing protease CtpA/Prc